MFLALAIVCDEYFVPSLEVIIDRFNIPNDIAGATLMAAGGSMPELFTSLIGTFQGSNVGFGTIVGSAVFNVLFVIGCCAIFAKETLELTWWPLFRDCVCYCIALLVLATFFGIATCQAIHWYEALILLAMYGGYCVLMVYNEQAKAIVSRWCCGKGSRVADVAMVAGEAKQEGGGKEAPPGNTFARTDESGGSPSSSFRKSARRSSMRLSSVRRVSLRRQASFHLERVDQTFRRPMSVRVGVLTAFLDESPLISSAALIALKTKKGGMEEVFSQIDKDGSGVIEVGEVKTLLQMMWERAVSDAEVEEAMRNLDTDQDKHVSFQEFADWYMRSDQRLRAELDQKFDELDADRNGYLTPAELRPLLVQTKEEVHLSDEAVASAMEEIENLTKGTNRGALDRAEFGAWYKASLFWEHQKKWSEKATEMQYAPSLWKLPEGGYGVKLRYALVFPLFFMLHYTIFDVRVAKYEKFFALSFLSAIAWIGGFSYVMVWMATSIGVTAGIPSVVMGLTFLAAGTSIPDLLTSVIVAKQGEGDMAVSSSIGSNIFDVLVGLPFPWLIKSLASAAPVAVVADSLFTSVLILFLMLAAVITTIAISGWRMTKTLGATMFGLYGIFVWQDLFFQFCIFSLPPSLKPCSAPACT